MYKREIFTRLVQRLIEPRRFMQVLAGPRQVGKTTLIHQVMKAFKGESHYASADEPVIRDYGWIEQQWQLGRLRATRSENKYGFLLVLDEIQKIPDWSTVVKKLWDQDTKEKLPLKIVMLGSSPLLIQKGLSESLAGRFETTVATHWSFAEMKKAFGWSVEQYIYFGGYPGAASLIKDEQRWRHYISDSLIETTLSRDILLMNPVNKPAILRRLFHLGCHYSAQILSYQKMLGQLQDTGNTTTLAHYLELLAGAGMLTGIQKFAGQIVRQRGSSPKFQVLNTALMTAQQSQSFKEIQQDHVAWGRLVESAIGAHLLNAAAGSNIEIYYWREGHQEVDFVLRQGKKLIAIEVKSGRSKETFPGLTAFQKLYHPYRMLLVGDGGLSFEEFFTMQLSDLFK